MDSNASDLRKRRRIKWWWNFVGRTDGEIRKAREEWMTSDRFGEVKGYDGARLDAPEVPAAHLKARGRVC
ncbi:pirin [Streptomyces gardneri]|nr:pirin [Streptomyces gardneri]